MDLKYKTALTFIFKILKRADGQDVYRAIKLWKLNSGLTAKMFEQ